MNSLSRFVCACLLLGAVATAKADALAASIFGSGMVLQRDRAVPIWGTASPGEEVAVTFGEQKVTTKSSADGRWKLALAAMPASSAGRDLTIIGAGKPVVFKDVLVGEVWLCSGQSNMVWELRSCLNAQEEIAAANYPSIRVFTAGYIKGDDHGYKIDTSANAKRYALRPLDRCEGSWKPCTPANASGFSGVAYFFGRRIHQELKIPVGLIVAAQGATAIEAWIGVDALKEIPAYRERAESFDLLAKAYLADPESLPRALEAQDARIATKRAAWFKKLDDEDPGLRNKWSDPSVDVSSWSPISLPLSVDDNPIGSPVASIWFRKEVEIPEDWLGKDLELRLGTIDAVDETFVNGVRVGRTWFDTKEYWDQPRVYSVPAPATKRLVVTLRLLKTAYHMLPKGPAVDMRLALKDTPLAKTESAATPASDAPQVVSLAGEWRMKKACDLDAGLEPKPAATLGAAPGNHYGHPGVQYNGLIHPIAPYAIRGALWYQGEANVPFYIDYRSLLPGLIRSWRSEWGQGDFPFGIVQLADYYGQQTKPFERVGYHNVREAQAMALSVPGTFLATAVGVGEGGNIHPRNKQEVGRRLAQGALGFVYSRADVTPSGPRYKSMTIDGDKIRLTFEYAKGLHAESQPPVGFIIAGENRAFYFAHAKIEGESIVVWSEKVPKPVAVRYAWASNPICNVYNGDKLPLIQFATDSWDLSQVVITDDKPIIPEGWKPK